MPDVGETDERPTVALPTETVRRAVTVRGIVHGVGFRPHVHRLVTGYGLAGTIANTTGGVAIEVQGGAADVDALIGRLRRDAPPLAQIVDVHVHEREPCAASGFHILPSRSDAPREALISPDVATCDDCRRELFDVSDRRHRYPFINCTNCGPRYTIVRDIPYDRPLTAMAPFPMCEACRAEYADPADRRFHAQATTCSACGPRLSLLDRDGTALPAVDPIASVVACLVRGDVVAMKGLGGFHLAVEATNSVAVERLRERKRRVGKPFAVMVPDLAAAERLCEIDAASRAVLTSPWRPIVLLPRRDHGALAAAVAPGVATIGVFLPYTPVQHLLFAYGDFDALVMTSGNLGEEPIAIDNDEAVSRLAGLADSFLVSDREIVVRCDDSVTRVVDGRESPVRRARGYVPSPLALPVTGLPPVLAVGGEMKSTLCVVRDPFAFVSQHVGELENLETLRFFEDTAEHMLKLLGVAPRVIARDLHPDYRSTQWAVQQGHLRPDVEIVSVQHHHAHIAACMAEHGLTGEVIGVALDGTGLGTDGNVWGGEVLVAGYSGFTRAAQLEYVPMPGGAACIREPWRMAVSYLAQHLGSSFLELDIPFVRELDKARTSVLLKMIERGVNSPLTSSCGRLFDAVSALAGVRGSITYEAQAAIELEAVLDPADIGSAYPFEIRDDGGRLVISARPMLSALLEDLRDGVQRGAVSRRFHDGLITALADVVHRVRATSGLERVCFGGGTFHNARVLRGLRSSLERDGFQVFAPERLPAGDGGLSLGQAMIAAHASR